jgi:hypothetical protein
MATLFSDVLTQYAMQFIDDVRWQEQLATNPAQFFRAKSQALITSIPRFNRPPNIQSYFAYTLPSYDDFEYTIKETDTFPLEVSTDKKNFDLCSVGAVAVYDDGGVEYIPIPTASYDKQTGIVTITEEQAVGTVIDFDFYTDGIFQNTLDPTQQRILGLCVAYDWYYRMSNAYLNVLNPITDKTFSTRSSTAEDKRNNTQRFIELGKQLSGELMAYEQRLFALKYIPQSEWSGLISTANANPSPTDTNVYIDGNTIYIRSRSVDVSNGTIRRD